MVPSNLWAQRRRHWPNTGIQNVNWERKSQMYWLCWELTNNSKYIQHELKSFCQIKVRGIETHTQKLFIYDMTICNVLIPIYNCFLTWLNFEDN